MQKQGKLVLESERKVVQKKWKLVQEKKWKLVQKRKKFERKRKWKILRLHFVHFHPDHLTKYWYLKSRVFPEQNCC